MAPFPMKACILRVDQCSTSSAKTGDARKHSASSTITWGRARRFFMMALAAALNARIGWVHQDRALTVWIKAQVHQQLHEHGQNRQRTRRTVMSAAELRSLTCACQPISGPLIEFNSSSNTAIISSHSSTVIMINRDSPDESQTGINVRVFPALLQDRREVLIATSTSGNSNAWSRV